MMSFAHGTSFLRDHQFCKCKLSCIQPHDIFCWMALKVYGKDNLTNDDHPTEGQSTLPKYYKK
eukprot:388557-Ditylum_brightwellii.AAC.1